MRNVWWVLVMALGMTATPRAAHAVIGVIDDVPAATLLLPYFEVDPAGTDAKGVNTLITVVDASASAGLAHFTVWTDAAVPVMTFDAYYTGFDRIHVDLRRVLAGTLPRTASDGQDPQDTITPQGDYSQDINFASCTGTLPPSTTPVDPFIVAGWKAALTGQPDPTSGKCSGFDHGDGIMRGYVTIDSTNACSQDNPSDAGYFIDGGGAIAGNRNIMFGDWTIVDRTSQRHWSAKLIAIEADASKAELNTAGQYTFYGRYVNWTASDNREPLVSTLGVDFGVSSGGLGSPDATSFVVWRDTKKAQFPYDCGTNPSWYPLGQESVAAFDDEEQIQIYSNGLTPFPLATQRVLVDSQQLPVNATSGWMFLNLNANVTGATAVPAEDPDSLQNWVCALRNDADAGAYGARGHVAVVHPPLQFDNATDSMHQLFGP